MRALLLLLLLCASVAEGAENIRGATTLEMNLLQRASNGFIAIAEQSQPAVVNLQVEKAARNTATTNTQLNDLLRNPLFEQMFGPAWRQYQQVPQKFREQGRGSGFIISPEGLILTNNHLVAGADNIKVTLADKREFDAVLVGGDSSTDVALLKINTPAADDPLPVMPLGDSSLLQPGEWVLALGNPTGLAPSVTSGVVSTTGRSNIGSTDYENFIQTDAAISPGNSGGPLVNTNGEVVGITTSIFSENGIFVGTGFAIPINLARSVREQLQQFGHITRGWLGAVIQEITPELAASFGLPGTDGVLISRIEPASPAAAAGLRAGDVVTGIDNIPVNSMAKLRNSVGILTPGTHTLLTVRRDGAEKQIPVTIGERGTRVASSPSNWQPGNHRTLERFGLTLQELTPENSRQHGWQPGSGLLITDVVPGSPAARTGLKQGELVEGVNRRRVKTLDELNTLMKKADGQEKLLLRVRNGEFSTFVVLKAQ